MLIRPFSAPDAEAVNTVALAAFAQYEGEFSDWDLLTSGVRTTASLADFAELIVAEEDSRIVGLVGYVPPGVTPRADFFDLEWAIIRMLVVDPESRGKGIGRKLTEECIARGRRHSASVIALHTSPAMEVALRMYRRMGFELARPLPERFGVPYGLYLLNLH